MAARPEMSVWLMPGWYNYSIVRGEGECYVHTWTRAKIFSDISSRKKARTHTVEGGLRAQILVQVGDGRP